ncbi:MAG TPA: hypothetical protein ENK28_08915 [Aliiroseovarius sp.]|nr:hypothetical protein [Aliiroseovarius sp.]
MRRLSLTLILLCAPIALAAAETAVSADGKWQAALDPAGQLLITSTETGQVARTFNAVAIDDTPTRFEGVYFDPKRRHFVLPLVAAPEYWLIATDPNAPPVYEGFVHSREPGMVEGIVSSQGLFARRRVVLESGNPLTQLEFSQDFREMTGLSVDGHTRVTVNLYVNREIAFETLP